MTDFLTDEQVNELISDFYRPTVTLEEARRALRVASSVYHYEIMDRNNMVQEAFEKEFESFDIARKDANGEERYLIWSVFGFDLLDNLGSKIEGK